MYNYTYIKQLEFISETNYISYSSDKILPPGKSITNQIRIFKSAGLAGVSSEMGLDDGLLVCTLLLLI